MRLLLESESAEWQRRSRVCVYFNMSSHRAEIKKSTFYESIKGILRMAHSKYFPPWMTFIPSWQLQNHLDRYLVETLSSHSTHCSIRTWILYRSLEDVINPTDSVSIVIAWWNHRESNLPSVPFSSPRLTHVELDPKWLDMRIWPWIHPNGLWDVNSF